MPESKSWISAKAWTRFAISHLSVEESLLGRRHQFRYDGQLVTVKLPSKKELETPRKTSIWDALVIRGERTSYRQGPKGEIIDASYSIYSVDVTVDIPRKFRVRQGSVKGDTAYGRMSESERSNAARALDELGAIAPKAYGYWLRVVRWRARSGLIGQPSLTLGGGPVDWGTRLVDSQSKSLGYAKGVYRIPDEAKLNQTKWLEISHYLKKSVEPPIWCELFFEGVHLLYHGNVRAGLANLAFASEVFVRSQFMDELPEKLNPNVREVINRQIYPRMILDNYIKKEKSAILQKKTLGKIHQLLSIRDQIVHHGKCPILNIGDIDNLQHAVADLVFSDN